MKGTMNMDYNKWFTKGMKVEFVKYDEFGVLGQCLHAKQLEFLHPITQKQMKLEAPMPEYFQEI